MESQSKMTHGPACPSVESLSHPTQPDAYAAADFTAPELTSYVEFSLMRYGIREAKRRYEQRVAL